METLISLFYFLKIYLRLSITHKTLGARLERNLRMSKVYFQTKKKFGRISAGNGRISVIWLYMACSDQGRNWPISWGGGRSPQNVRVGEA